MSIRERSIVGRGRALLPALAVMGLALSTFGCAEDQPGTPPPKNALMFPVGLAVIPGTTPDRDVLVVANSNFDQRYNAGTLVALSVDRVLDLATGGGTSTTTFNFVEDLSSAIVSQIRVLPFAGQLLYIPGAAGQDGLLLMPSRVRNALTTVVTRDGQLDCSSAGGEKVAATDCTRGYVLDTGSLDPYEAAYDGKDLVAIAHLRPLVASDNTLQLDLPVMSVAAVRERLAAQRWSDNPIRAMLFPNIDGASGVAFVGAEQIGSEAGTFLITQRLATPSVPVSLAGFDVISGPALQPGAAISIGGITQGSEMRGLVVAGDRAYVSVRYPASTTTMYTSAIATVAIGPGSLKVLSVFAVGEEVERPFLQERSDGQRLLYLPDVRRDEIFVVDVRTDAPSLVGEIKGRMTRTVSGNTFVANTLDAPSAIAFVDRGAKKFAFVSNFRNGTVAVLDATDPSPSGQRLVARLGIAVNPDGTLEGTQ